ncbi:hypothetical protein Smic_35880 [Streptomyces microflavus]|uniref:Uncharacterized protein n=1 Tax=Streptomyces microflavus TaxID=1919 RepID=A0A7J0CRD4_STRMI|nr:hypothetical protein Smic_35880 [Streptomyces microflavus]
MNALNDECERNIEWLPVSGFQLRKAGVQFDAVRVDGDAGRRLADLMEELVGESPARWWRRRTAGAGSTSSYRRARRRTGAGRAR